MGMQEIQEKKRPFDGWLRIYPTLRCNLECPYCVTYHNPKEFRGLSYPLLSGKEWIDIINSLGRPTIFTGGEPFIHPDFMEILSGIRGDIPVKVYTNFTFSPDLLLERVKRPVVFYGSYHPVSGPPDKIVKTINAIRESSLFEITIHAISWQRQEKFLKKSLKQFEKSGWDLITDEDQYQLFQCASQKFRKRVICKNRIVLIAPNGQRFPCGAKLFKMTSGREILTGENLQEDLVVTECEDYGYCAPCDGLIDGEVIFL